MILCLVRTVIIVSVVSVQGSFALISLLVMVIIVFGVLDVFGMV